jgi:hypothetical protein
VNVSPCVTTGSAIRVRHYIPIRRDFSNVWEVLELVQKDNVREEITNNAYQDIAASEKYTYKTFVEQVLVASLADAEPRDRSTDDDAMYRRAIEEDQSSWRSVKRVAAITRRIPTHIRGVGRLPRWFRRLYLSSR